MIICWHCQATLFDGTIFCDSCGAALLTGAPHRVTPPTDADEPWQPVVLPLADVCSDEEDLGAGVLRLVLAATGQSIALPPRPALVVGRGGESGPLPDVDLGPFQAAAAGVSRAHALIDLAGPRLQIEDLESTNGTYVNGRRIPPGRRVPVRQGDEIYLGQMALRIEP